MKEPCKNDLKVKTDTIAPSQKCRQHVNGKSLIMQAFDYFQGPMQICTDSLASLELFTISLTASDRPPEAPYRVLWLNSGKCASKTGI
jgi:hypothetical protein